MNIVQQRLLDISKIENIDETRRIDLMRMANCEYPSQITYHLEQLIKRGDLVRAKGRLTPAVSVKHSLIRIPVMGEADCGEATKYADGRIIDTLAVSKSVLAIKNTDSVYALTARGDSMNRATVAGKEISDGDYIIVQKHDGQHLKNGDIVVSIIEGLANVKRFRRDETNKQIVLMPDSYRQEDFAPIVLSENDAFGVAGKVIDVVKVGL